MEFYHTIAEALEGILDIVLFRGKALNASLLLVSIDIPLLVAFVLLAAGGLSKKFVRILAVAGFVAPALISVWLWYVYFVGHYSDYAFASDTPTGLENFGISLKLGLNGISLPLYLLAGIVGLAAGIYAINSKVDRLRQYLILLLFMQGGLMGIFASIDLFFYYFFHEIALIPTFIMIAVWGGRGRRSAAMEMAIYLTLGALLSLIGLLALYSGSGLNSFDIISMREYFSENPLSEIFQDNAYALLLFGFGILVSLWPFHSWAPRAYGAAPAPVAMMHAGVLKKFGLYGLIQIGAPLLPFGASQWTGLLIWLALGNIILIGLATVGQRDLKQMIGYSSVMHMGYAFLGIACFSVIGVGGAVLLMFAHGLSVALLFMLADCIYRRTGTCEMHEMGGLCRKMPVLTCFFAMGVFANAGLPGFANFWGELGIFIGIWKFQPWLIVPAVAGILISALYGLRAARNIFFGDLPKAFDEKTEMGDIRFGERLPALVLLTTLILIGFWPRAISDTLDNNLTALYPSNNPTLVIEEYPIPQDLIFDPLESEKLDENLPPSRL